jgi:hypothetical protein
LGRSSPEKKISPEQVFLITWEVSDPLDSFFATHGQVYLPFRLSAAEQKRHTRKGPGKPVIL